MAEDVQQFLKKKNNSIYSLIHCIKSRQKSDKRFLPHTNGVIVRCKHFKTILVKQKKLSQKL